MMIKDNTELINELRELLIKEDKKSDKRRLERIDEVRKQILINTKRVMQELSSKQGKLVVKEIKQIKSLDNKKHYSECIDLYREFMAGAVAMKEYKDFLREKGLDK